MNNRMFKGLIFSLTLFLCVAKSPLVAQTNPREPQPTPSTQPQEERSTWQAILNLFRRRKEPYKGSRPASENVCPISPGLLEQENTIWSVRPLFVWQENRFPLEIRLYSPFDPKQEQEIIWQQTLKETSPETSFQGVQYNGEALEPDKIYDWELFNTMTNTKIRRSFRVMNEEERRKIREDLQNLEDQMREEKATDEAIAIAKANYFAQRELWSDALQEIYSIQNVSDQSHQVIQEIVKNFCQAPNVENLI